MGKAEEAKQPTIKKAALEIFREDGSISTDMKEILKRWHSDISRLFSGLRENPEFAFDDKFYDEIVSKKNEFEALTPEEQEQLGDYNSESLNVNLT